MSENKRYTYLNYSKDGYIGSFYENDKPLTNKEVLNILNNQKEEINTLQSLILDDEDKLEELKKENERYKFAYNELISYIDANFDEYMTQKKLNERIRELEKENEQLKKDRFICLDCKYCGHTEIGCLCEKQDHWEEFKNECNDFKELKY